MGGFLSFVKKETLHIVRDPRTMLIALLMPVVQILLFGFAISTEVNNVNVAVVASRPSETIRQAVTRIEANPYFTLRGFIPASDIDRTLRAGDADAVDHGARRRGIESRQKFREDFKVVRNEKRLDAFREKTARNAQGDARIAEIVDDAAENLYGSGLHGGPFGSLSRYNTRVSGVRAGTPSFPDAHD